MKSLNKFYLLSKNILIGEKNYNYKTKSLILSKFDSHFIFDINQSIFFLKKSLKLTSDITKNRGNILLYFYILNDYLIFFKNIKKIFKNSINICLITNRWIAGSLSNYKNKQNHFIKKVPNLVIIINNTTSETSNILNEASQLSIPVIVLISSNFKFDIISYPIFGNISNFKTLYFFITLFCNSIIAGKFKEKLFLKV